MLVASPGGAQPPARIGRAEFLRRVETADPRLEALAARVEQARAERLTARQRPNPTFSLRREQVSAGGETFAEHFPELSLPVDLSGRRGLLARAAALGAEATAAEVEHQRALLLLDALELYEAGLRDRLRVAALGESRQVLERVAHALRERVAAGDVAGFDLDRVELELGALEEDLALAELDHASSRRMLGLLAGAEGSELEAGDDPALPGAPAPASGARERGDQRGLQHRIGAAEAEGAAARRAAFPRLVLTAGVKTSDLGPQTAHGWVAGLALELPIFDRGQGERARTRALLRELRATGEAERRRIENEISTARDRLERRVELLRRFEATQLPRLERLEQRADLLQREGERPVFELLDAWRTAREIRLRGIDLGHEARRSQLALLRAMGRKP